MANPNWNTNTSSSTYGSTPTNAYGYGYDTNYTPDYTYANANAYNPTAYGYGYPQDYSAQTAYMNPYQYQMPVMYQPQPVGVRPRSDLIPNSSLWIGELEEWMDEPYLYQLFSNTEDLLRCNIIKDRKTGKSNGYGFVYFSNPIAAKNVLEAYNGQIIPGTNKRFRLNYAAEKKAQNAPTTATAATNDKSRVKRPRSTSDEIDSIFVGNLAREVTQEVLQSTFAYYYPSVYSAKVVYDQETGNSKGYGFVYFTEIPERDRALQEMNGFSLCNHTINVSLATKKGTGKPTPVMPLAVPPGVPPYVPQFKPPTSPTEIEPPAPPADSQLTEAEKAAADPTNKFVLVNGIDNSITYESLRNFILQYGEIVNIKLLHTRGIAYIEFHSHEAAEAALKQVPEDPQIGNTHIKVTWGRPPKPKSETVNQQYGGYAYMPPANTAPAPTATNATVAPTASVAAPTPVESPPVADEQTTDPAATTAPSVPSPTDSTTAEATEDSTTETPEEEEENPPNKKSKQ